LPGVPEIDRTTMNSWEDADFRAAVDRSAAGRVPAGGAAAGANGPCQPVGWLAVKTAS
jgi:hypothetical protein